MPSPTTIDTVAEYHLPHERFHANSIEFCRLVKDVITHAAQSGVSLPISPLMLDITIGIISSTDANVIIETFIKRSAIHWNAIHAKDIQFFRTKGLDVFNGLPEAQVQAFNSLFDMKDREGRPIIDAETLDEFWSFFHSFVKIAVCHIHLQRKPDPTTKKYTQTYFGDISIKKQVDQWQIRELK